MHMFTLLNFFMMDDLNAHLITSLVRAFALAQPKAYSNNKICLINPKKYTHWIINSLAKITLAIAIHFN